LREFPYIVPIMSQIKDSKDPITSALMYAELGMDDTDIAKELKEVEGIEDDLKIIGKSHAKT